MFGLPVGKVRIEGKSPATLLGNLALINEAGGQTELTPNETKEIDSGFDVVIGNPPYIRIQTLKKKDPKLVAFYKNEYASAAKGNYDLYVVFIEAGLRFLKPDGHLAYICPHKFFNSQYGEPLREVVAKGRHLRHVVHFGDQQVFPGATIYTCLLFLAKGGSSECRMVRVDDLDAWKATLAGIEGKIPSATITRSEWNLTVGRGADIYGKLASMPVKLGDVAEIFVGLQTSADTVFVFKESHRSSGKLTSVYSKESGKEVQIETALLKPVVRSGELGRYWAAPSALVLFPYQICDGRFQLISHDDMAKKFSAAWTYLKSHRKLLSDREEGSFRDDAWYRFGRTQNLDQWEQAKIMLPYMITDLAAYYDSGGTYFVNVTTGGFGITTRQTGRNLEWLTVLLNSNLLDWFLKKVSTTFHGGYFAANKQFLVQLPIVDCSDECQATGITLSRWLRFLKGKLAPANQTTRDPLMLAYFEQILNGLAYELYFQEEVHGAGLRLFELVEQATLPSLETIPASKRLEHLRPLFETLYDGTHPLKIALQKLQTLDTVRIIEGNA